MLSPNDFRTTVQELIDAQGSFQGNAPIPAEKLQDEINGRAREFERLDPDAATLKGLSFWPKPKDVRDRFRDRKAREEGRKAHIQNENIEKKKSWREFSLKLTDYRERQSAAEKEVKKQFGLYAEGLAAPYAAKRDRAVRLLDELLNSSRTPKGIQDKVISLCVERIGGGSRSMAEYFRARPRLVERAESQLLDLITKHRGVRLFADNLFKNINPLNLSLKNWKVVNPTSQPSIIVSEDCSLWNQRDGRECAVVLALSARYPNSRETKKYIDKKLNSMWTRWYTDAGPTPNYADHLLRPLSSLSSGNVPSLLKTLGYVARTNDAVAGRLNSYTNSWNRKVRKLAIAAMDIAAGTDPI